MGYHVVNGDFPQLAKHDKNNLPNVFNYTYPRELDFTNEDVIRKVVLTSMPNIIIHTAAYVGTDKCEADYHGAYITNALALDRFTKLLNTFVPDSLFVNFGTTATCDPKSYGLRNPITETTERGPRTWYGMTKWQGEQVVKKNCKKWINFLPVFLFNKYPFDNSSIWPKTFIASGQCKEFDILLDPRITKQYEWSSNVVDIMIAIIKNKDSVNRDVVIAGNERLRFGVALDIASEIYRAKTGLKLLYNVHPEADYSKYHVADNSLMLKLAGMTESAFNKKRKSFKKAISEVIESCL